MQRKLKDAGRFVFIDQVKKNPSFLVHIPSSLGYVRTRWQRRPELREAREILAAARAGAALSASGAAGREV